MPRKSRQEGLQHAGELLPGLGIIPAREPLSAAGRLPSMTPKLSPARVQLIEAAADIRQNPDDVERSYMARQLVQCTLPHRDPGDVEVWTRTNGNLTLVVRRGYDSYARRMLGYPYGSLPRLLLFWLITEAVQKRSRRIELGHSLSKFMLDLGLNRDNGTGKRSDARRFREQTVRLFSASLSFQESGPNSLRFMNMDVSSAAELWWNPTKPDQSGLWGSWVELGEKFYAAVTAAPVPADLRVLKALKRSPLALDLYVWATYKAFTVSRKGEPQSVPWEMLMAQFGAEYADVKNFRLKARNALQKIAALYPDFRWSDSVSALCILPSSRPSIPH